MACVRDLQFGDVIQSGSFGQVVVGTNKETGERWAVKRMESFVLADAVHREVKILTKLQESDLCSNFVVGFQGYYQDADQTHCLVFSLMACDLDQWLTTLHPQGLPAGDFKLLAGRMLGALEFLRAHSIIHGDITPSNVLMSSYSPTSVRICDFGMSQVESPTLTYPSTSLSYRAPEVILGAPTPYPQSLDVWGVGCVLMGILMRVALFQPDPRILDSDDQEEDVLYQQVMLFCMPPESMLAAASEQHHAEMLRADKDLPAYRSSQPLLHYFVDAQDVRNIYPEDSALLEVYDFLESLLRIDPSERPKPADALTSGFFSWDMATI